MNDTNVSQLPKQPSESAVKKAGDALNANSKRAFDKEGILDGTVGFDKQGDQAEGQEPEVTEIAGDNKPVVPKPSIEINKFIMGQCAKLDDIEAQRSELTAQASLIREELKSKGIDVATLMYQRRVMKLDEDKRIRIDETSALVRAAGNKPIEVVYEPIQEDLFKAEATH